MRRYSWKILISSLFAQSTVGCAGSSLVVDIAACLLFVCVVRSYAAKCAVLNVRQVTEYESQTSRICFELLVSVLYLYTFFVCACACECVNLKANRVQDVTKCSKNFLYIKKKEDLNLIYSYFLNSR